VLWKRVFIAGVVARSTYDFDFLITGVVL